MQRSRQSIVAGSVILSLLVVAGCQRGGDTGQPPTASVQGPGGTAKVTTDPATPKSDQDPLHPIVVVETSQGKFTLRLDAEKAPLTVDNFLRYVGQNQYDGTIFHQVLKEYPGVILGGGFSSDLKEKKTGIPIRNEAHNGLKNRTGTIAMARRPDNADSATAHFFINLTDNDVLDYKDRTSQGYGYCVFGEVTAGMDIVKRIGQVPVRDVDQFDRIPVETVAIKSVRRIK